MKLGIIILNRIELLEDLLSAFIEIGISNANVVDSVGMGHIISHNIPIFAGLMDAFTGSSPKSKTIIIIIKEEMVEKVVEVVKDIFADSEEPDNSRMVFLPVEKFVSC